MVQPPSPGPSWAPRRLGRRRLLGGREGPTCRGHSRSLPRGPLPPAQFNRGHWTWSRGARSQAGAGPRGRVTPTSRCSPCPSVLSEGPQTGLRPDHTQGPAQSPASAGPRRPAPRASCTRLRTLSCCCWRGVGRRGNLKFNLLSFSHREKVSKNSLACQNC